MKIDLDRRVTIQRKVVTQDASYGSEVVTWGVLAVVWAELRDVPPGRSETIRQGLQQARNQTRVRMRYRADVDSSMRIVDGTRVLQIIGGPAELGRREFLEVMTEAYSTDAAG